MNAQADYTINDLELDTVGPIWVLNGTMAGPRTSFSDVSFGITLHGQSQSIVVPQTWIPINLTEQAPRASIIGTTHFRKALMNGLLRLVPPQEAAKTLAQPRAKAERDRLSKAYSVLSRISTESIAGFEFSSSVVNENEVAAASALPPAVQMFVDRLAEDTDQPSAINTLISLGVSTVEEFQSIETRAESLKLAELAAFCSEELIKLSKNH